MGENSIVSDWIHLPEKHRGDFIAHVHAPVTTKNTSTEIF